MPNSITKNKKDEHELRNIIYTAFPNQKIEKLEELSEGFFNVAYTITMTDGTEVILKIAPHPDRVIMTHENNIMFSEVDSMKKVAYATNVPVAEILYYDNSHKVCDADYFFMKKLSGKSFSSSMEKMTPEQNTRYITR